jgi:hypothetical protein
MQNPTEKAESSVGKILLTYENYSVTIDLE